LNRRSAVLNFERGHAAFENGQVGPGLLWMVEALQSATAAEDPAWKHTALTNLSAWLPLYPRLRAVLSHSGAVRKVAFSPDGRTILTGSRDTTARLWNAATGQPIGLPMQHPGEVRALAFSPDGKTILTGSQIGPARLWDDYSGPPDRHLGVR
jgi:WD40 repeat protein